MKRKLTTGRLSQSESWRTAKPLLGKLIKWTVWTVLALTIAVVILYGAGSYRRASADSIFALVRLALVLSLLLIISSVYGLILDVFYVIRKRKAAYLAGIAGYLVLIALGAVIALGAAFVIGAVGGNLVN